MTIQIDDKTFDNFASAVEHVKKTKPQIKDAEAYVSSIEQRVASINCPKTNLAKLKARIAIYRKPKKPTLFDRLDRVLDYSPEDVDGNTRIITEDELIKTKDYIENGTKIRPPKPTQADRKKIITAKQNIHKLKQRLAISYNKHYIYDPFTPTQYGADDEVTLLDQVSDDVERHASEMGRKYSAYCKKWLFLCLKYPVIPLGIHRLISCYSLVMLPIYYVIR